MRKPARRKSDFLWHRPNSSAVWFSRAVPKRQWEIEGRKVIQFSLGTANRREAEIAARRHATEQDARWGVAPFAEPTTDPTSIAVASGFTNMTKRLEESRLDAPDDDEGYAAHLSKRDVQLRRLARRFHDGDLTPWDEAAHNAIQKHDLNIVEGSPAFVSFQRALAESTIEALSVFSRRASGETDAAPRSETVRKALADDVRRAKAGETIMELFEKWAAHLLAKGEKRPDTVNQDRIAARQFAEFVGKDRAIRSITPVEVADYRETLRMLPPRWRDQKALAGLSIREAAKEARKLGMAESAFTSVNKHLSTVSPLYKWLASQPAWAGLANPCNGLFHTKVKGKNRRPSFATADLNKILRSPLFTGFQADGREHLPGNVQADDWRKWVPLVCLFTGARIGEIAQLRVGDIRQERGEWFIHIAHDEPAGLSTKSGKSRPAAVHAMLKAIGFLDFYQRRAKAAGGDAAASLFPELKPNKRGQISGEPSRFWRDYLAAIGVKSGGDGFGAHSFRHTLADRLRSEAELLDAQIAIVLGHSQPSTTGGYGELSQGTVSMLKGWADALRFDGVDFQPLREAH